jgi:hypothetical protein
MINKRIHNIVFGTDPNTVPLYSDHVPETSSVDTLKQELEHLGVTFKIEDLPRSILKLVTCTSHNIVFPIMPGHKAICLTVLILEDYITAKRAV